MKGLATSRRWALTTLLALAAILPGGNAVAGPEDALEPNDSIESASVVNLDAWEQISLPATSDRDFIKFDVKQRGHLFLDVANVPERMEISAQRVMASGELDPHRIGLEPKLQHPHKERRSIGAPVSPGIHVLLISSNALSRAAFQIRLRVVADFDGFALTDGEPRKVDLEGRYAMPRMRVGEMHGFELDVRRDSVIRWRHVPEWGATEAGDLQGDLGLNLNVVKIVRDGERVALDQSPTTMRQFHATRSGHYQFFFVGGEKPTADVPFVFFVLEDPTDRLPETASVLPLNAPQSIQLSRNAYDYEYRRLEVPAPGSLSIVVSTGVALEGRQSAIGSLVLLGGDGKTVVKTIKQAQGSPAPFQPFDPPDRSIHIEKAGTFFLKFVPHDAHRRASVLLLEASFAPDERPTLPAVGGEMAVAIVGVDLDETARHDLKASSAAGGAGFFEGAPGGELAFVFREAFEAARSAAVESERLLATRRRPASEEASTRWLSTSVAALVALMAIVLAFALVRRKAGL